MLLVFSCLHFSVIVFACTHAGLIFFFSGNINLPRILPFLGKTQLEVLSVIVSLLLLAGHLLMAILVKERVLCTKSRGKSFRQELRDIWSNMKTLPHVIRQIVCVSSLVRCVWSLIRRPAPVSHPVFVRFSSYCPEPFLTPISAWIAWFPILFYSTIYIGDLYKWGAPVAATDEEQLLLDAEATRLGSRALFFSSILSLIVNVALPAFVPDSSTPSVRTTHETWWDRICRVPKWLQIDLATLWAVSHLVFAACMFATLWVVCLLSFLAVGYHFRSFTDSVWGSTVIITVTGFPWAVTQWAPFSLVKVIFMVFSFAPDFLMCSACRGNSY